MATEDKKMLATVLSEIRTLKRDNTALRKSIADLSNAVGIIGASRTKKVTISQYAEQNGVSTGCVRKRLKRGVLNAEKIGGMYYIVLPA